MAAGTFKVTAKTQRDRRNTTKLPSPATLSALAALAAMLFSAFFFVNTSENDIGANNRQAPAHNFTSKLTSPAPPRTTEQAREAYGGLPMSFEANRGQAGESVNFVARGAGYTLALSPTEAVFQLRIADRGLRSDAEASGVFSSESKKSALHDANPQPAIRNPQSAVLRMNLVGANRAATFAGQNELEGRVNYFIGNDPAQWRTDVPTFGRVRYAEVYPGIDVVYYGNQRRLEYDFVLAPGRDAREIALEFAGAERVEIDGETGDLLLRVGESTIRQHKPFTYQETAGGRREVESRYALRDGGRVGFEVGEYDASAPLVIDPVLEYSTYLGGTSDDGGSGIAVDSAGNAYVTGATNSTNFPTANPIQGTLAPPNGDVASDYDVFITKINAAGTALVYSTYLGGNSGEGGLSIAVDSAGNAYLTGFTRSTNFPTAIPIDSTYGGANDAFVTKINAAGSALVYSTYLGGSGADFGNDIALDSAGNAYLTGETSGNFPTANPFDGTYNGGGDAFVTKINAAGTALVNSSYLGGSGYEFGNGIAVDSAGNAYITGDTRSTNFPAFNAIQPVFAGDADLSDVTVITTGDAFVTKINAAGTAFVYSTYLGGTSGERANGIALDSAANAYVTGRTASTNFPTANALDNTYNGNEDAFVTKINAAGTALVYSTYLGGNNVEIGIDVAVDSAGNAYVAGFTASTNFPTVNPIQILIGGAFDVFATKINTAGSALVYSTYLGGCGSDFNSAIALDSQANAYLTGDTPSSCFPTTTGAFDTTSNGGGDDAFISKISETGSSTLSACTATATVQFSTATFNVTEGCVPATLTVTLTGTPTGPVAVDYTVIEGTAKQKTDFTYVAGTLLPESSAASRQDAVSIRRNSIGDNFISGSLVFAAGETSKEITVLITEDGFAEGTETLSATLSNPRGAGLGCQTTTTLRINDNETVNSTTNPIDDAPTYVCQLYHDFLHRQPDPAGQAFWTNEIAQCGTDQACISARRHNVAAAFFLAIEFQQTGYFAYRAYEAGLDRRPQYEELMRDLNAIGLGVEVGIGDWQQRLAQQRLAFAELMVQSDAFKALFPEAMTAEQFADKLFANAGATPTQAERQAVVTAYGVGNTPGRGAALVAGMESASVYNRLYNPGFVFIEYFGFMRRDPDDAPDTNLDGFNFWLTKMDSFTQPGEDARAEAVAFERIKRAEMVRAFIESMEYRQRFGP